MKEMLQEIHKSFLAMLLLKDRRWLVASDKYFRVVRAKESGTFRRFRAYIPFGEKPWRKQKRLAPEHPIHTPYCESRTSTTVPMNARIVPLTSSSTTILPDEPIGGFSLYYAEFIADELAGENPESILETLGIKNIDPEDYTNIVKSKIYIFPDIPFYGEEYFEILFKAGRDGRITKERKEKDSRKDTRQIRGHAS